MVPSRPSETRFLGDQHSKFGAGYRSVVLEAYGKTLACLSRPDMQTDHTLHQERRTLCTFATHAFGPT